MLNNSFSVVSSVANPSWIRILRILVSTVAMFSLNAKIGIALLV